MKYRSLIKSPKTLIRSTDQKRMKRSFFAGLTPWTDCDILAGMTVGKAIKMFPRLRCLRRLSGLKKLIEVANEHE